MILLIIVFAIFILSGCSVPGVDLTQYRTYAITKPPFQIVVSGDLSKEDKTAVQQLIRELDKTEYKDYRFNEGIFIHVVGSETEIESINVNTLKGVGYNGEKE